MTARAAAPSGAAARPDRPQLPAPIAALVEVGVLDEITASWAQAEDISRAHPVWRVGLADGRRLVVKAGIGHGGPDLAVECLVYRMTWWCEPLGAALPVPLVVDEDRQLLVLSDVAGSESAGSLAQHIGPPALLTGTEPAGPTPGQLDPEVARALGRTVGGLHRATAGYPLPPAPPPLVLGLVGRADEVAATARLTAPVRQTLAELGGHRIIAGAVEELRRPVAGCLVNHDLKWDNVVVDGAERTRHPVLLDWELAGLGDPAWDVGCLLAEHLVRAPEDQAAIDQAALSLLAGYRDGARPRPEVVSVLAHRVHLAAGLRIAQLALEVAYTPYSGGATAIGGLIDRARATLADAHLTEEVRRCLT